MTPFNQQSDASTEWPVFRAVVTQFGSDPTQSYSLARENLGVNAVEAKSLLKAKELEIARGDGQDVKSVARRFRNAGARVRIDILGRPSLKISAGEALKLKAYWPSAKAVAVEGNLAVTGMFSYLQADDDDTRAVLLSAPNLGERLSRKGALPICGGMVRFHSRAVVEGHLRSIDLPMFPTLLQAVSITLFPSELPVIQIKYVR